MPRRSQWRVRAGVFGLQCLGKFDPVLKAELFDRVQYLNIIRRGLSD
jgi:hypothetical protein